MKTIRRTLALLVIAACVAFALTGCGSSTKSHGPSGKPKEALAWVEAHGVEAEDVAHTLEAVEISIGKAAKEESPTTLDELATQAQEAHNHLNELRETIEDAEGGELEGAEVFVTEGVNGLKNAMGALVAYTGNPTPATFASFKTQYQSAAEKYNLGITAIWDFAPTEPEGTKGYHSSKVPTVGASEESQPSSATGTTSESPPTDINASPKTEAQSCRESNNPSTRCQALGQLELSERPDNGAKEGSYTDEEGYTYKDNEHETYCSDGPKSALPGC